MRVADERSRKLTIGVAEELAILKGQELIYELMAKAKVRKCDLAKLLKISRPEVTNILRRNMTLRTLGRICFALGVEVEITGKSIK